MAKTDRTVQLHALKADTTGFILTVCCYEVPNGVVVFKSRNNLLVALAASIWWEWPRRSSLRSQLGGGRGTATLSGLCRV